MHLETLLYMLVQSDRIRPPPGPVPDFQALARAAQKDSVPNAWIKVPPTELTVGLDDPEDNIGPTRYFGWDNEKPARKVQVPAFEAKARPLTNQDFARYLCATGQHTIPASWGNTDGEGERPRATEDAAAKPAGSYLSGHSEPVDKTYLIGKSVRTVYGPVALEHALAWPVYASYDELAGCAKWMNGRIPTADEVRSIYNYANASKTKEAEKVLAKKISAVNGCVALTSVR